eukprot:1160362-Pelagomonas_calceolata.AAC.6
MEACFFKQQMLHQVAWWRDGQHLRVGTLEKSWPDREITTIEGEARLRKAGLVERWATVEEEGRLSKAGLVEIWATIEREARLSKTGLLLQIQDSALAQQRDQRRAMPSLQELQHGHQEKQQRKKDGKQGGLPEQSLAAAPHTSGSTGTNKNSKKSQKKGGTPEQSWAAAVRPSCSTGTATQSVQGSACSARGAAGLLRCPSLVPSQTSCWG